MHITSAENSTNDATSRASSPTTAAGDVATRTNNVPSAATPATEALIRAQTAIPLRILLIDNYDSYTFNLLQLFALAANEFLARPDVTVIKNDEYEWDEVRDRILPKFDAVVLSPGPGTVEKAEDFGVCRQILLHCDLPVLGVCLGHQGLAYSVGGRIVSSPEPAHGLVAYIEHDGKGIFEGIPTPFQATRYHSLVVSELDGDFPETKLRATAWTTDANSGRKLIMGIEAREKPFFGVQFHPESICSQFGNIILRNFCNMVPRRTTPRPQFVPREPSHSSINLFANDSPSHHVCIRKANAWLDGRQVAKWLLSLPESKGMPSVWLDSSMLERGARWSYIAFPSESCFTLHYFQSQKRLVRRLCSSGKVDSDQILDANTSFFDYAENIMSQFKIAMSNVELDGEPVPEEMQKNENLPPFLGGLLGYIGYEMKRETLPTSHHPAANTENHAVASKESDVCMVLIDEFVAYDHATNSMYVVCLGETEHKDRIHTRCAHWQTKLESIKCVPEDAPPAPTPVSPASAAAILVSDCSPANYVDCMRTIDGALKRGESYEICLTSQFRGKLRDDVAPLDFYLRLRESNPAPYSALLVLGDSAPKFIACSSPELFLRRDRNGVVEMKPIKGTMKRCLDDPIKDAELATQLENSAKDRAENLMIVDLTRNDLNEICGKGSVSVPKLMQVETFRNVHQMVSTVSCALTRSVSSVYAFKKLFPPGSMTGAPKLRTVQLLESLERAPRGAYGGCIGYFSACGGAQFNVIIRTVVGHEDSTVSVGAGSAIVIHSTPENEWEEMMLKVQSVAPTIAQFI